MDIKKLLEVRKSIKSKKPKFVRQDIHKKSGMKRKWRRPKGLQSKLRLGRRGKYSSVSAGWRSPKKVRGLHNTGLEQKRISSVKELELLDSKKYCILISSSIGNKKRLIILKKAKELGFNVTNIDSDKFIKKVEEKIEAKEKDKEKKKKSAKEKTKKKEEKLSDRVSEDDKDAKKKEKDKLLSKRER